MMAVITILINVGMYAERITIIPLTLATGRSPFDWGEITVHYADIAIPAGSMCMFIFLYLVASRVIPLVPVWEVQEGQEAHILRQVGKTKVPSVSELE
jgi:molybdopterin-containing oxidoreductase family membrane subunit